MDTPGSVINELDPLALICAAHLLVTASTPPSKYRRRPWLGGGPRGWLNDAAKADFHVDPPREDARRFSRTGQSVQPRSNLEAGLERRKGGGTDFSR